MAKFPIFCDATTYSKVSIILSHSSKKIDINFGNRLCSKEKRPGSRLLF